jgi:FkbM family methyltransferase
MSKDSTPHSFHRPDIEGEDAAAAKKAFQEHLVRLVRPNDTVVDIGANRGQFALEVIEVVPEIRIFAFEPAPDAYLDLCGVAQKNPQISPRNVAISTEQGESSFYVTKGDEGSSLLKPLAGQPSKWLTVSQEVKVRTERLEHFIGEELNVDSGFTVSLLKSDCQGADFEAITSAGKYLNPSMIKAILVETNFTKFYQSERPFTDLFAELDVRGYRLAWLYPHRAHDGWLWWGDALFLAKREA